MSKIKIKQKYIAILIGAAVMLGLSAFSVLILPVFIINEYLPIEYTSALIVVLIGLIAFAGAAVAGFFAKKDGWSVQVLSGVFYSVLWVFIAISFFDGISVALLCGVFSCAIGCTIASVITNKANKRNTKRKKRKRNS